MTVTCQNGGVASITATVQIVATLYNPPGTTPLCQVVGTLQCGVGIVDGIMYVTVSTTILVTTVAGVMVLFLRLSAQGAFNRRISRARLRSPPPGPSPWQRLRSETLA